MHDSDLYILCTDGGSRGNPGPAAAGYTLRNPAGQTIREAGLFIGRATNNVAEYRAVVAGMHAARELDIAKLQVRSDSELLVRQLCGQYRVKSPDLQPFHAEILSLARQMQHVEFVHVYREQNRRADELVNMALDAKADVGATSGRSKTAGASAAAVDWPPDELIAECTEDAFDACPGVVSKGGRWEFRGVVPNGLCVHAAAGILQAVQNAKPGTKFLQARCAKPGCTATFRITTSPKQR